MNVCVRAAVHVDHICRISRSSLAFIMGLTIGSHLMGMAAVYFQILPLYLVTMASQNLPGFAVLKAAGYPVPSRSILAVTGLSSLATAGVGAHTSNLAAITASICTGPDAHPDKDKRWLCGPFYAGGYAVLAIFGASLVALFASFPQALIAKIAGIALTGPLVNALGASFRGNGDRFAAVVTFAVTASGMSAFGIGSAFWGLVAGLIVFGLDQALRRKNT